MPRFKLTLELAAMSDANASSPLWTLTPIIDEGVPGCSLDNPSSWRAELITPEGYVTAEFSGAKASEIAHGFVAYMNAVQQP